MAMKFITESILQSTADAIRAKTGGTETITPADFPNEIASIPSGGSDTLADAMSGNYSGELIIDYGNNPAPSPGVMVTIGPGINGGITKITYICNDGTKEASQNPIRPGSATFGSSHALQEIDFGNLEETYFGLGSVDIGSWGNLTKVTAKKLKKSNNQWGYFLRGSAVSMLDFPVLTEVPYNGLMYCSQLKALLLRNPVAASLKNTSALSDTPIASGTGYIYVPRDLIITYQAATNWTVYANQFRAIEDYTSDGTLTGEFIMPAN